MRTNNSGQALLIIMLAMATIATLTLSIVSRSVSQVEITNREEESQRAFSAAEAGVEKALLEGAIGETTSPQNLEVPIGLSGNQSVVSTYTTNVEGYPAGSVEFEYPFELFTGESGTVWMVTRNGNKNEPCTSQTPCYSGSQIRVCWGTTTPTQTTKTPAIVVTFIYESGGNIHTLKQAYDPIARSPNNFFTRATTANCAIGNTTYRYQQNIDFASIGLPVGGGAIKLMNIKSLYNDNAAQGFGVVGSTNIPPQGRKVTSTGVAGNSTRKIDAYILNPSLPSVFEAAVFSYKSITK